MLRMLICCLSLAYTFRVGAEIVEVSPDDDLRAAIVALQPGDELMLADGVYAFSSRFNINVVGESNAPIVIRAKADDALIEIKTGSQNIREYGTRGILCYAPALQRRFARHTAHELQRHHNRGL